MALSRARTSEVPQDAVILSEDEALTFQWETISKWEKSSEVWALRHGPGIMAVMAGVTGLFVNSHYRKKLRLGPYGRFSTYLPIVVVPAVFVLLSHKFFVQRSILLDPVGECPTCVQMRSLAFQAGFGVVYPTILAPLAVCMFATRHFTYRLPSVTENPMEVFRLIKKFTKPIVPVLTTVFVGQSLIAVYIAFKEQQQNLHVLLKMKMFELQMDQKLEM